MAMQTMKETNASFGQAHEFELEALSLRDAAERLHHVKNAVASKYDLQVKREYLKANKSTLVEIRLSTPEMVGDFCSFELFTPAGTASKSLRFSLPGTRRSAHGGVLGWKPVSLRARNSLKPACCARTMSVRTSPGWP